jgi:hypothetical protein
MEICNDRFLYVRTFFIWSDSSSTYVITPNTWLLFFFIVLRFCTMSRYFHFILQCYASSFFKAIYKYCSMQPLSLRWKPWNECLTNLLNLDSIRNNILHNLNSRVKKVESNNWGNQKNIFFSFFSLTLQNK